MAWINGAGIQIYTGKVPGNHSGFTDGISYSQSLNFSHSVKLYASACSGLVAAGSAYGFTPGCHTPCIQTEHVWCQAGRIQNQLGLA